jgi:hypothetical protein
LCRKGRGCILDHDAAFVFSKREEIVSVVVILLMFLAVIAMVKKLDDDQQSPAIPVANPREAKSRIGLQSGK